MRSVKFAAATLVVAAAAFASGVTGAVAGATAGKVMICGANASYNADVQSRLAAMARFAEIDVFDCGSDTPTQTRLSRYAAVLVIYSTKSFADAKTLGDRLVTFVDGGGRVVEAEFDSNPAKTLMGRWHEDGYSSFELGPGAAVHQGKMAFVADVPSSPLLDDVNTFNGGSTKYHLNVEVAHGAVLIAHWADRDSTPLEAAGPHSTGLNFSPPAGEEPSDFWNESTDGQTLIANALAPPAAATAPGIGFSHITVCATKPVYRVADGSWGMFADIDLALWNAAKHDASSPYFASTPAVYVAGYGLMCQVSDVGTYGGDAGAYTAAGYNVDGNGNTTPAGMSAMDAGAYYAYYVHK